MRRPSSAQQREGEESDRRSLFTLVWLVEGSHETETTLGQKLIGRRDVVFDLIQLVGHIDLTEAALIFEEE